MRCRPKSSCASFWTAAALAVGGGGVSAQTSQPPPPQNVVSLSASASREVVQDELTMTLAVLREGTEAAQVQSQIKQVLDAALVQARQAASPDALDVRTGAFNLSPRYNDKGRLNGWQGHAELVLSGTDTAGLAQLAGRLKELNVTGVQFGLSRRRLAEHEAAVTADAILSFRARAAAVAKGFGLADFSLREIHVQTRVGGEGRPGPMMARMADASEASAPIPVEAGKSSVIVTVEGSIQLR